MSVRILRAADRTGTPWKNGGGITHEIAVWPPGAGLHDFAWRVSMATVAQGGPFSEFPGVDRSLSVLEGELTLAIAGRGMVRLNTTSPPLAFPGDIPVTAETPPSPVRDLNVMTRRGVVRADVTRSAGVPPALKAPKDAGGTPALRMVVSRSLDLRLNGVHRLGVDDAALIEDEPIQIEGGGEFFVIHFTPA